MRGEEIKAESGRSPVSAKGSEKSLPNSPKSSPNLPKTLPKLPNSPKYSPKSTKKGSMKKVSTKTTKKEPVKKESAKKELAKKTSKPQVSKQMNLAQETLKELKRQVTVLRHKCERVLNCSQYYPNLFKFFPKVFTEMFGSPGFPGQWTKFLSQAEIELEERNSNKLLAELQWRATVLRQLTFLDYFVLAAMHHQKMDPKSLEHTFSGMLNKYSTALRSGLSEAEEVISRELGAKVRKHLTTPAAPVAPVIIPPRNLPPQPSNPAASPIRNAFPVCSTQLPNLYNDTLEFACGESILIKRVKLNQQKLNSELRLAADGGDVGAVETLLKSKANVNSQDGEAVDRAERAEKARLDAEWGLAAALREVASLRQQAEKAQTEADNARAQAQRELAALKKKAELAEKAKTEAELASGEAEKARVKAEIATAEADRARVEAQDECDRVRAEKNEARARAKQLQEELNRVQNDLRQAMTILNERDRDVLMTALERSKNIAQEMVIKGDRESLVKSQAQAAATFYHEWRERLPKSLVPKIPKICTKELRMTGPLGGGIGGTVLQADWRISQPLEDQKIEKKVERVAWKMPFPHSRAQGQMEANVWKTCPPHPNLITLRAEVHQEDGTFDGVVMDLCSHSLEKVKLGPVELMKCAREVTRGLAHLHSYRILHRDLAPRNILVQMLQDGSTRYAITDFGLSRTLDVNYMYERCPGSGMALPWRTLAPEIHRARIHLYKKQQSQGRVVDEDSDDEDQDQENEDQDKDKVVFSKPCDVWALGVTLWELATTQRAYVGERGGPIQIQKRIGNGILKLNVEQLIVNHREIAPAIIACLQHNPKSRPTAAQVLILLSDDSLLAARLFAQYNEMRKSARS